MNWTKRLTSKMMLCVLCLMLPPLALAKALVLSNIKTINTLKSTRFLFDLDGQFTYRGFSLHNPERYVLDFKNVSSKIAVNKINLKGLPVNKLRCAEHKEYYRFVFDLPDGHKVSSRRELKAPVDVKRLSVTIQKPQQKVSGNAVSPPKTSLHARTLAEKPSKHPARSSKRVAHKKSHQTRLVHKASSSQKAHQRLVRPKGFARDIIVVIDPGHGGKDPGAAGSQGAKEKEVVLAIAKKLQRMINAEPGFKAILTRKDDRYLRLRQRLSFAHKYNADMFVAIHADAYRHNRAHGASVYAVSARGATSEAARWLAKRENESEFVGGLELSDRDYLVRSVLIDLSQTHVISASLQMGSSILGELGKFTDLHHSTVEQAAFVVLKSPDIPSLLVETGFLSNPKEEANLSKPTYQKRISLAIKHGIKSYFVAHPPRGTRLATNRNQRQNT